MDILLHPTYMPSIAHFVVMAQADNIVFEVEDNYQKQTYRNRSYIFGANGRLMINIPVIHSHINRQKYKDVKIAGSEDWQSHNWKSIESAYRSSPFFEFYEDDLNILFTKKYKYILDHNFDCLEVLIRLLELNITIRKTTCFKENVSPLKDYRFLANARLETPIKFEEYNQVFSNKYGFISNLSILDLLFNEGPNTVSYLESQQLKMIECCRS
ncbi:MAG: WbqC family protein [Melioribacteraceae bacterium]|nr:WbqC family protein [Melioribacteraceae bacterium]